MWLVNSVNRFLGYFTPYTDVIGIPIKNTFKPVLDLNDYFSEVLGLPTEATLYLMFLTISIFAAMIYRLIPRTWYTVKHLFNISLGLFAIGVTFGWSAFSPLITVFVGWLSMKILPARVNLYFSIFYLFTYLSLLQIYFLFSHFLEWKADVSAVQMILTFKLCALAFNFCDGQRIKNTEVLEKHAKETAIFKVPSLFNLYSYSLHFCTCSSGPFFEYRYFIEWIENKKPFPVDAWGALKRIILAFFFLAVYSILGGYFKSADLYPENLQDRSIIETIFLTYLVLFWFRGKYYIAWYFAEGICIISGFGYSGKDEKGKPKWENVETSDVLGFEFSTSVRMIIVRWNISVSKWLRYYVYERVPFKNRTVKSICAMIASAIWHGWYPGYYLMWTALVFLNMFYIDFYSRIRPRFSNFTKKFWWLLFLPLHQIAWMLIGHICAPFAILSWDNCTGYYSKFYWGGHVLIFALSMLIKLVPRPPKQKKK